MRFLSSFLARSSSNIGTFLLGTVIASTGWLLTHVVDKVTSVPTIEYAVRNPPSDQYAVTLRNLSRHHKFTNLEFVLFLALPDVEDSNCTGFVKSTARIVGIPPSYAPREMPEYTPRAVTFTVSGFHPATSLRLMTMYNCPHPPRFHIAPESTGARLVPKGATTWLIRNEARVLFGLLVVWALVVLGSIRSLGPATLRTGT